MAVKPVGEPSCVDCWEVGECRAWVGLLQRAGPVELYRVEIRADGTKLREVILWDLGD